ncbi:hypothetical protein ARMGADRAFT_1039854 [Armillaria gallica]|uniref:Uncharacterized protein n=1 Tax=Armillaria gallica TaxID=47427 RepID=A0A2H3CVB2_ARMGA|nr:hypothetical protein ARMGADRAFT_1039854 [Armillaria gallica]
MYLMSSLHGTVQCVENDGDGSSFSWHRYEGANFVVRRTAAEKTSHRLFLHIRDHCINRQRENLVQPQCWRVLLFQMSQDSEGCDGFFFPKSRTRRECGYVEISHAATHREQCRPYATPEKPVPTFFYAAKSGERLSVTGVMLDQTTRSRRA